MIRDTEIERYLDDWLGNAPMAPADRTVVAVAVRIGRERQRPAPRFAWAVSDLLGSTRALGGLAAILLIALVGSVVIRYNPMPGNVPTLAPSIQPTPAASPTTPPLLVDISISSGIPKGWTILATGLLSFQSDSLPSTSIEIALNRRVGAANCAMAPEPGVDGSAEAFVHAIAERRGVAASGLRQVELSDLPGWQVDVTLDTSTGPTCTPESPYVPLFGIDDDGFWNHVGVSAGERMRIVVLDVPDGQNIVILIVAPDASTFDRDLDDAMAILTKVSFTIGD